MFQRFGITFETTTLIYIEEQHLQNFIVTACDTGVDPKFTCWKNVKNSNNKYKSKFYCHVLLNIHDKLNNLASGIHKSKYK